MDKLIGTANRLGIETSRDSKYAGRFRSRSPSVGRSRSPQVRVARPKLSLPKLSVGSLLRTSQRRSSRESRPKAQSRSSNLYGLSSIRDYLSRSKQSSNRSSSVSKDLYSSIRSSASAGRSRRTQSTNRSAFERGRNLTERSRTRANQNLDISSMQDSLKRIHRDFTKELQSRRVTQQRSINTLFDDLEHQRTPSATHGSVWTRTF